MRFDMRHYSFFAAMGMVLMFAPACRERSRSDSPPPTSPGKIEIAIAGTQVTLEVVADRESVRRGLMFRDSLAPNSGMLFAFPGEGSYPFWMKNTRIPLAIAFLDRSGRVVGLDEMEPFDTVTLHLPSEPFIYAVEMDSGWFCAHGLKVGDTIQLPPFLTLTPR